MRERDTIEFEGVTYTRFPDSPNRHQRSYYFAPRGSGRSSYHRDYWTSVHGPIPQGFHIHHLDENPLNNDIRNLVCLSPEEHANVHPGHAGPKRKAAEWREHLAAIQPKAAEWHRSEEGRAWHREHGKRVWVDRKPEAVTCSVCGITAERYFKRGEIRFCSRKCARAKADNEHRYEQEVPCPICGSTFRQNKYKLIPATCSRLCGADLRKRNRASLQS